MIEKYLQEDQRAWCLQYCTTFITLTSFCNRITCATAAQQPGPTSAAASPGITPVAMEEREPLWEVSGVLSTLDMNVSGRQLAATMAVVDGIMAEVARGFAEPMPQRSFLDPPGVASSCSWLSWLSIHLPGGYLTYLQGATASAEPQQLWTPKNICLGSDEIAIACTATKAQAGARLVARLLAPACQLARGSLHCGIPAAELDMELCMASEDVFTLTAGSAAQSSAVPIIFAGISIDIMLPSGASALPLFLGGDMLFMLTMR